MTARFSRIKANTSYHRPRPQTLLGQDQIDLSYEAIIKSPRTRFPHPSYLKGGSYESPSAIHAAWWAVLDQRPHHLSVLPTKAKHNCISYASGLHPMEIRIQELGPLGR